MIVVVGIQSLQDEAAEFSLVMNGPEPVAYDIVEMTTNNSEVRNVAADETRDADNSYIQIFKWYNWGHGDFNLEVATLKGDAKFYLNRLSETDYQENGFSGIGLNAFNSAWVADLSTTVNGKESETSLQLTRSDTDSYPDLCYNCWYYITVVVDTPVETEYRVWFSRINDSGSEMAELFLATPANFALNPEQTVTKAKFLLSSTAVVDLKVECSQGDVFIAVHADPDNLDESVLWSA